MPRIYVACLASYNAGRLHGKWFDLEDYGDADDLQDAVRRDVMITSPHPNVLVECPTCEGHEKVAVVRHGCNDQAVRRLGVPSITTWHTCSQCRGTGKVLSAEEWAIHDHEGFPEDFVGEYSSFSTLYDFLDRTDEAEREFGSDGLEILEAYEQCFNADMSDSGIVEKCRDAYRGKYDSGKDFSYELAEETGEIPKDSDLANYIDWEYVWNGRDRFNFSEHNGFYFWNC